jgi:hypothetical protein
MEDQVGAKKVIPKPTRIETISNAQAKRSTVVSGGGEEAGDIRML